MSIPGDVMPKHLRFRLAVGSKGIGLLSSVWSVWSNNNGHVMITARGMHGVTKFTLHSNGHCHFNIVQEHHASYKDEREVTPVARSLYAWHRISPPHNTGAPAFVLQLPGEFLYPRSPTEKAVEWIKPAPKGMASTIVFSFTTNGELTLSGWDKVLAYHDLGSEHIIISVKEESIDCEPYRAVIRKGRLDGGHLLSGRKTLGEKNASKEGDVGHLLFFHNVPHIPGCKRFVDVGGLLNVRVLPKGPPPP
jgi:hypothetical protein